MASLNPNSGINTISSWSGGKDSCLACYKAIKDGYDVRCLLNFVSKKSKRGCFHGVERGLLSYQAGMIGIPLIQKEVSDDMDNYEKEFKSAVSELKENGAEAMVFGDIYLLEHNSWVERVTKELDIRAIEPLWNRDTTGLVEEFCDSGFNAIIVSCKADIMGKEYLGRRVDRALAAELKGRGICPCGENGEYHTLVVDGPIFKKPIEIVGSKPVLKEGFWKHWFLDIKSYS